MTRPFSLPDEGFVQDDGLRADTRLRYLREQDTKGLEPPLGDQGLAFISKEAEGAVDVVAGGIKQISVKTQIYLIKIGLYLVFLLVLYSIGVGIFKRAIK